MKLNPSIVEGLVFLRAATCEKLGRDYLGAGQYGFKNNTFEMREYDWQDYEEDDPNADLPNFKYQDLEITWYKHISRGTETNKDITISEFAVILTNCLLSLGGF